MTFVYSEYNTYLLQSICNERDWQLGPLIAGLAYETLNEQHYSH